MIVNRRTFVAKPGHCGEAYDLFKALAQTQWPELRQRFYKMVTGQFGRFCWEWECENLAEYEKIVDAATARVPADFWTEWYAIVEEDGSNELWKVE